MKRGLSLYASMIVLAFCSISLRLTGNLEESTFYIVEPPEGFIVKKMLYDVLYLHVNLVSADTLKLTALFAPWYIAARSADRLVHSCFYCDESHINLCQMPRSCHSAADKGAIAVTVGLASLAIMPCFDDDIRLTARVFAAGIFPLWGLKNAFKRVRHEGCLRPKCEFFDKNEKYYGGCPSGHTAFVTYGATLFGLQCGYRWAVPLGLVSLGVFAGSVNSNRHYVSQIVAGAGLGIMYGVAAQKVVAEYLDTKLHCEIVAEQNGMPAFKISHSF